MLFYKSSRKSNHYFFTLPIYFPIILIILIQRLIKWYFRYLCIWNKFLRNNFAKFRILSSVYQNLRRKVFGGGNVKIPGIVHDSWDPQYFGTWRGGNTVPCSVWFYKSRRVYRRKASLVSCATPRDLIPAHHLHSPFHFRSDTYFPRPSIHSHRSFS